MGYIRSAGLRGFRATVAELGGDADRYARAADLAPEALDADDLLVTDVAAATVLEVAARDLGVPDLGLRIAARQDITMLGSLAVAIQNSPTLGEALECTSRYLFVHGGSLSLRLGEDPRGAAGVRGLYYGPATADGPVQGTDLGLGFVHRTITYLHGGAYGLRGVELPYRPPAPPEVHEAFFGSRVRVGAVTDAAVLRLPTRLAEHRLEGVNDTLRQLALAFLAEQAPQRPAAPTAVPVAPRVRAAVQGALGTGSLEVADVARLLAMHHRTLQRRLEAEGTTFGAILDDVRRQTVHRLLTQTDLPLSQVSAMAGFAEQSTLSRAVRRWWGTSPRLARVAGRDGTPVR